MGTRIIEAIIIAAITAAATGYVSVRVVEAKSETDREAIAELKSAMKENTRALMSLTTTASAIEIKAEARATLLEARLRILEDSRRRN